VIVTDRTFWVGTAERALKTFFQSFLAAMAVTSPTLDILHTNWAGVLSLAFGATLLSVATSMASINVGLANTPAAEALRLPAQHSAAGVALENSRSSGMEG
jgi:hypothetical protein